MRPQTGPSELAQIVESAATDFSFLFSYFPILVMNKTISALVPLHGDASEASSTQEYFP